MRHSGADVEIKKFGHWSRTNGIGPDPQNGFRKWCRLRVASRSSWHCGYCAAATTLLDFRGFWYLAVAANAVRERTRRLEKEVTPSTVPGCSTPHPWCEDGSSLSDVVGPEFTLTRFDPAVDVAALGAAARDREFPLKIVEMMRPMTAISCGSGHFLWQRVSVVAAGPARGLARRQIAGRSAGVDRLHPRCREPGLQGPDRPTGPDRALD
jgi:hypothetical protein